MPLADSVALLGVKGGPAIRPGSAMPTASLLTLGGRRVVVDCGLGVARGLTERGMALATLETIFLTHLHSDHCLELGPLIHTAWTAGLRTPVRVFGPEGTQGVWDGFLASLAFDIDLRIEDEGRPDLRGLVSVHPIREGVFLREAGLVVSALPVPHPPIREAWALRFEGAGRAVVFSGDTAPHPPLAAFARGADLLIHEAMLPEGLDALIARIGPTDGRLEAHIRRSHSFAADAARIAAEAGVKALALHHLIPADDPAFTEDHWRAAVAPHWSGPLHVGRDGLTIPLGPADGP